MEYSAAFDEEWPSHYAKLDEQTKERVAKKISKLVSRPKKRHLKGNARFFVDEIGQQRIIYRVFDETNTVRFYFVGNHKDYEKWYQKYF